MQLSVHFTAGVYYSKAGYVMYVLYIWIGFLGSSRSCLDAFHKCTLFLTSASAAFLHICPFVCVWYSKTFLDLFPGPYSVYCRLHCQSQMGLLVKDAVPKKERKEEKHLFLISVDTTLVFIISPCSKNKSLFHWQCHLNSYLKYVISGETPMNSCICQ